MTKALQEPTQPVRLGFQILLGLANAGAIMALSGILSNRVQHRKVFVTVGAALITLGLMVLSLF